jgi:hypothetical protein
VNKARAANLGEVTENWTRAAGGATTELTPSRARALAESLTDRIENFSHGPRVPLTKFPQNLLSTLNEVSNVTGIAGGSTEPLRRAIANTVGTPGFVPPFTRTQSGMPIPNYGVIPKSLSAAEALAIRSKATKAVHSTEDWAKKEQFMALRDNMDDAIRATHPDKGQAFDKWRAEYDTMKRIEEGGVSATGKVLPENMKNTMAPKTRIGPETPLERETVAAAARMASPSLSENRSLAVRLLMGAAPYAAVGGAGVLGGPLGAGAATATLALAHKLLGTPGGGRYLTGQTKIGEKLAEKGLTYKKAQELARLLSVTGTSELTQ